MKPQNTSTSELEMHQMAYSSCSPPQTCQPASNYQALLTSTPSFGELQDIAAASKVAGANQQALQQKIACNSQRYCCCPELYNVPANILGPALMAIGALHKAELIKLQADVHHLVQIRTGRATCKVYMQLDGSKFVVYEFFCHELTCQGHVLRRVTSGVAPHNWVKIEGSWECNKHSEQHECLVANGVWPRTLDYLKFKLLRWLQTLWISGTSVSCQNVSMSEAASLPHLTASF